MRSTLRSIVSPGAIAVASTLRRFVEAPAAPRAIVTVPEATVWLADVELVKVANVPRPAMLAVAPRIAIVRRSFRPRERNLRSGRTDCGGLAKASSNLWVVHRQRTGGLE